MTRIDLDGELYNIFPADEYAELSADEFETLGGGELSESQLVKRALARSRRTGSPPERRSRRQPVTAAARTPVPILQSTIWPGQECEITFSPQVCMGGPYYLGICEPHFFDVVQLMLGNECIALCPGSIPAEQFTLGSPEERWPEGLIPFDGPSMSPANRCCLTVRNRDVSTRVFRATLWCSQTIRDIDGPMFGRRVPLIESGAAERIAAALRDTPPAKASSYEASDVKIEDCSFVFEGSAQLLPPATVELERDPIFEDSHFWGRLEHERRELADRTATAVELERASDDDGEHWETPNWDE